MYYVVRKNGARWRVLTHTDDLAKAVERYEQEGGRAASVAIVQFDEKTRDVVVVEAKGRHTDASTVLPVQRKRKTRFLRGEQQ